MAATPSEFAALLALGIQHVLKGEQKQHPVEWGDFLKQTAAVEFTEDGVLTSGFGAMPEKSVGGAFTIDSPILGTTKTVDMTFYGLGFVANYELYRWEKYGVFSQMAKKLSLSGIYTKNVVGYSFLNSAFVTTTADLTTHQSEALCTTSHTLLRGTTTGKNAPTTAVALSYLALQEAFNDFATLVNEDGLEILLKASWLIVHANNLWVAETLIHSDYRPDNENMAKNTVKGRLKIHDTPFLTTAANFFLTSDKGGTWGDSVQFHMGDDLDIQKDVQPSTRNSIITCYGSWRMWVLDYLGIWGSAGS